MKKCGFTLIEVLVTVVILSVGIIAVLQAFDSSITGLTVSRESLRADSLLEERIAQIRLDAAQSEDGRPLSDAGSFSDTFSDFSWRTEVSDVSIPSEYQSATNTLYEVSVMVRKKNSKRAYLTTTYIGSSK